MAVRAMVEGGESFSRLRVVSDAAAVSLQIDLLNRDQVPLDLYRDIGDGARIRASIEFNGAGQRTPMRSCATGPTITLAINSGRRCSPMQTSGIGHSNAPSRARPK